MKKHFCGLLTLILLVILFSICRSEWLGWSPQQSGTNIPLTDAI